MEMIRGDMRLSGLNPDSWFFKTEFGIGRHVVARLDSAHALMVALEKPYDIGRVVIGNSVGRVLHREIFPFIGSRSKNEITDGVCL
jgi:hypothetical protein